MSDKNEIPAHYTHGNLVEAIQTAIAKLGIELEAVSVADLGPVDEFHMVAVSQPVIF